MWARNQTQDAERAQDDANFGGAPADGGNRPTDADERGTITFWSRTQNEGPGAGDAGYHQHMQPMDPATRLS
jgi:hypothetical protein